MSPIHFTGIGAYNKVTNSASRGSIYFTGGIGAYNKVERRGYSGDIVTYKQDIAIGRMINNIGGATTNKISIARPSCIDNMISYTSSLEGNVAPISIMVILILLAVAAVILLPVQEDEAMET
jgi:hypothetical protein